MPTDTAMTDQQLFDACVAAVWRAVAGESRGGDDESFAYAMQLMTESRERHRAAGHTDRCRSDVYNRAYEQATAEHSLRPPQPLPCMPITVYGASDDLIEVEGDIREEFTEQPAKVAK